MLVRSVIFVFALFSALGLHAQNAHQSFENLQRIQVKGNPELFFSVPKNSEIFNDSAENFKQLPFGFSVMDFECEANSVVLAKVNLNTDRKQALLCVGICPEIEFMLYDLKTKELIESFVNYEIVIPGNGAVYTSGHISKFDEKHKYVYQEEVFVELEQPFYHVGLKSKTLRTVVLYADETLTKPLATLPPNYEIEVLLSHPETDTDLYLVKTSFGLLGWCKLEAPQYQSIDVEGLFYNND